MKTFSNISSMIAIHDLSRLLNFGLDFSNFCSDLITYPIFVATVISLDSLSVISILMAISIFEWIILGIGDQGLEPGFFFRMQLWDSIKNGGSEFKNRFWFNKKLVHSKSLLEIKWNMNEIWVNEPAIKAQWQVAHMLDII